MSNMLSLILWKYLVHIVFGINLIPFLIAIKELSIKDEVIEGYPLSVKEEGKVLFTSEVIEGDPLGVKEEGEECFTPEVIEGDPLSVKEERKVLYTPEVKNWILSMLCIYPL